MNFILFSTLSETPYLLVIFTNRDLIDFRLKKEGARSGPFTFGTTSCAREIRVFAAGS